MKKLAALSALSFLLATGCSPGIVGDPDVEVHRIKLYSDNLGALLSTECVKMYGEEGCSRYPNPNECKALQVAILGDGRTYALCMDGGKVTSEFFGGLADGLPFICKANADNTCQQCKDLFANTVYDNCSRGAALYRARGGGWGNVPEGSGWLGVPPDSANPPVTPPTKPGTPPKTDPPKTDPPPTPPAGSGNKCDIIQARRKYAENLNKILKKEGLSFTYSPDLSKKYDPKGGYWGYGGKKGDACKYWLSSNSKLTKCWNPLPGKCHCMKLFTTTCRCARVNVDALRKTCLSIPTDCDYMSWVNSIAMEYGVATKWLFSGTYKNGYYKGLPSTPGKTPPPDKIKCLGSPIVLDLADNGVAPTSIKGGVKFDIMGHGQMRTAWVKGDDALLVMDHNGNGIVDDGTELFGSATDIGGAPAGDGFEALALLDTNGNGLVESGDLLYGDLKLWRDRNHDGMSDKSELTALADAGVIGLEIQGAQRCGRVTDDHGNDLSLRASFIRADGRKGLMVDVLFGVSR